MADLMKLPCPCCGAEVFVSLRKEYVSQDNCECELTSDEVAQLIDEARQELAMYQADSAESSMVQMTERGQ